MFIKLLKRELLCTKPPMLLLVALSQSRVIQGWTWNPKGLWFCLVLRQSSMSCNSVPEYSIASGPEASDLGLLYAVGYACTC